jgi:hypothetical protein
LISRPPIWDANRPLLTDLDRIKHLRLDPHLDPMRLCKLLRSRFGLVPTVLRSGPYRIYFYSHEPNEPPHVHVDRDDLTAKFWLDPIGLAGNLGFGARELREVERLIRQRSAELLEAWHAYFGT